MLEKFQKDSIQLRKDRSPLASSMVTVMSEAKMIAKNDGDREVTEADLTRQIKKTVTNLNEMMGLMEEQHKNISDLLDEVQMLEKYLPTQMSDDELRTAIVTILEAEEVVSGKSMGKVMQGLKANHEGLFDGKMASRLVKTIIEEMS